MLFISIVLSSFFSLGSSVYPRLLPLSAHLILCRYGNGTDMLSNQFTFTRHVHEFEAAEDFTEKTIPGYARSLPLKYCFRGAATERLHRETAGCFPAFRRGEKRGRERKNQKAYRLTDWQTDRQKKNSIYVKSGEKQIESQLWPDNVSCTGFNPPVLLTGCSFTTTFPPFKSTCPRTLGTAQAVIFLSRIAVCNNVYLCVFIRFRSTMHFITTCCGTHMQATVHLPARASEGGPRREGFRDYSACALQCARRYLVIYI